MKNILFLLAVSMGLSGCGAKFFYSAKKGMICVPICVDLDDDDQAWNAWKTKK